MTDRWEKTGDQAGFTLLEFLIVIVLLTLGLLALLGNHIAVLQGHRLSQDLTAAVNLAEFKMEELVRDGFTGTSTQTITQDPQPVDELGNPGGSYTRTWTRTPAYQGSSNMEHIEVSTQWTDKEGGHTMTLETVLRQKE